MQKALRFLVCLVIGSSIALAATPRPASAHVPAAEKTSCCAKMKLEAAAHDCERHAPKSDQDKQCCALCGVCCALLATFGTPFVYPPVGDETFADYLSSGPTRSQRSPVPPPRV